MLDTYFRAMWHDHGMEVRGKPLLLDGTRYRQIQTDGRLGWFVARVDNRPVGYSSHWVYYSMHGPERLGHDDIWYVKPEYRGRGIGSRLKTMGHDWLREQGATETSDLVRHVSEEAMKALGFKQRGIWWVREL